MRVDVVTGHLSAYRGLVSTEWLDRSVLTGRLVRLEPLTVEHAEGLFHASADPDIWTWMTERQPATFGDMRAQIESALANHAAGTQVPYAQVDVRTGNVAGTTSYYDVEPRQRAVAIGHTWIGTRWQRTGLNTESKLLLLRRAFGELGAVRVVWHTHSGNERSQRAIERLGAVREGVLRKHRLLHDGTYRDTVTYSMLDTEWPAAEHFLTAALNRAASTVH